MDAAALPPDLRSLAPETARRVGAILRAAAAMVAAVFLKNPRYVTLIIPVWRHLTRSALRLEQVMADLAAGKIPHPHHPRPGTGPGKSPANNRSNPPAIFPRTFMWLVKAAGYHAAAYRSQLTHLLSQPETARLIEASPQAQRVLRPVCHLLGVRVPAVPPLPRRKRAPRPRPARTVVRLPSRLEPGWPALAHHRASLPYLGGPPLLRLDPPDLDALCPRLRNRWPFNTLAPPRPA